MDTTDEIPLEDHRYFQARLDHLESRHPARLLDYLESGTLTTHLRTVTCRAMQVLGNLVFKKGVPKDQANELVMNQVVADPQEQNHLNDPKRRAKLRKLLDQYRKELSSLPRTYLSENETIE